MIVLPNVDGWICDVCGDFVYDSEVVARAELLLGASARSIQDSQKDSAGKQSQSTSLPILNRGRAS